MIKTIARVKFGLEFMKMFINRIILCSNAIWDETRHEEYMRLKVIHCSIQFSNFEIFSEYYGHKIF